MFHPRISSNLYMERPRLLDFLLQLKQKLLLNHYISMSIECECKNENIKYIYKY